MVPLPWRQHLTRATRRLRVASSEHGFTLIEAVMAMAIFAVVSTALAGVLTSSISARSGANERTAAEQIANTQLEFIRSISYANVGLTTNGNPSGIVDATGDQSAQGGPTVPTGYTVQIKISWVDDSIPTSPATKANYKNVTVKVFRTRDAKLMTQQSTQIGPRQRAPYGGINKGIVNAQVQYYYLNTPAPDVLVNLNNGPSSPLADTSDSGGLLRFPALDPATGSTYYDLVIAPFAGYILLPDPTTTHFQIAAASATPVKVLQIYKPVTLTADFRNSDGTPYVGTVVFTVANSRGSKSYTYTGSPVTVTTITNSTTGASELLVPASYTITVTNQAAASFYTDPVTQSVPASLSNYPTDLAATGTVTADPLGSITATVTSAGGPVNGATVTVSGGPRSIATKTATTNASGIATIGSLPAGGGYTVTAARAGQSAPNQTASVSGGTATNLTFVLPTGHLKARATWNGTPVPGATISLTGGPGSVSLSGTADSNGEVLFSNVPAGSGYTLTAVMSGQTATASATVVGATTTTTIIALPTVTVVGAVNWAGSSVTGATVTLAGGPLSLSTLTATTNSSGQATFTNVPAGGSYTLTATKSGQTTTLTGQTLTTSPTTNVNLDAADGNDQRQRRDLGRRGRRRRHRHDLGRPHVTTDLHRHARCQRRRQHHRPGRELGESVHRDRDQERRHRNRHRLEPRRRHDGDGGPGDDADEDAHGHRQAQQHQSRQHLGGRQHHRRPERHRGLAPGVGRHVHDELVGRSPRDHRALRLGRLHRQGQPEQLQPLPDLSQRLEDGRQLHRHHEHQHHCQLLLERRSLPVQPAAMTPAAVIRRLDPAAEDGIMLIELITTIAVLGIFFAAFATVVGSSIRHGSQIQEEAVVQTEVRAAVDALVADLREATNGGDTTIARVSTATGTQLTFTAPNRTPTMHLRRISYQVTGGKLQRAMATSTASAAPWSIPAVGAWATLVPGIVTTATPVFTYYDAFGTPTATAANVRAVKIVVTTATTASPTRTWTYTSRVTLRAAA